MQLKGLGLGHWVPELPDHGTKWEFVVPSRQLLLVIHLLQQNVTAPLQLSESHYLRSSISWGWQSFAYNPMYTRQPCRWISETPSAGRVLVATNATTDSINIVTVCWRVSRFTERIHVRVSSNAEKIERSPWEKAARTILTPKLEIPLKSTVDPLRDLWVLSNWSFMRV